MFYAHSTNDADRSNWQPLRDHLVNVAALAQDFGTCCGIRAPAGLAGRLHDIGKYTPEFAARLAGSGQRVDHSTAGAAYVASLGTCPEDKVVCQLIAYAIAGHHTGLPDKTAAAGGLSDRLKAFDLARLDDAWRRELSVEATDLLPKFDFGGKAHIPFRLAFLGRMIFSCLVDADFKDTEAFYCRTEGGVADRDWPVLQAILPDLLARVDRHLARLASNPTPVNRRRNTILRHVRARAGESRGLFTLTVPTGGGKTLASLAFALDHAARHGHTRIIYAIPFTSIIDQTAATFGKVLGDGVVLEHHSAIDQDRAKGEDDRDKLKLAMEDWAAPVVVTTNVQFFESLHAARPSRCRKLHNIADSVIILDEAQTIPKHVLIPCVRALDELARNYGCSIVLCTATQPALDARHFPADHPLGLPLDGRELAPDPPGLAKALRRASIRFAGDMDNGDLIAALDAVAAGLVIVNSRRHALDLYNEAKAAGLDGLVHLTTRQIAMHRLQILDDIRRRLTDNAPCRVIATSLVEAGVDLDFPAVWRAAAGLDQIIQAAGRCNREGYRDPARSLVTVFSAPAYPPPAEIAGLTGDMKRIAGNHTDLQSPAAIADFFREVYWRLDRDLDRGQVLKKFRVSGGRTEFAYRTVAETFRLIESGLAPVIIPADDTAGKAVARLGIAEIRSGKLARTLQPYIVQVPPEARARLLTNGHVHFAAPDLRGDQFAVLRTDDLYTREIGLMWEDADYLGMENLIT